MKKILLTLIFIGFGLRIYCQKTVNTEYKIASRYFEEERTIKVHLPKNYDEKVKLPVIYILDAQWNPYFILTSSSIDYLTEIRELPKSIIIGINLVNRQYELTPAPVNEDWKMPSLGGAQNLENHLLKEVIPLIDSLYKVHPFRTVIGHSLGGTFALNSLVDNPTLFNAVIAISPNLQIDDEEIVLKMTRAINTLKKGNKFVFATIGTDGQPDASFLPPLKKLDSVLSIENSMTFDWNFRIHEGYNHATTPLVSTNSALLEFAKKWKITEEQKATIMSNGNVIKDFEGFYESISLWAGYSVVASKNNYYDFAGFLEDNKKYNDAIGIYKLATRNFPSESRFYNGIAENMMEIENNKEAKVYLEKALKILKNEIFEYENDKEYFRKLYMENLEKL